MSVARQLHLPGAPPDRPGKFSFLDDVVFKERGNVNITDSSDMYKGLPLLECARVNQGY